MCLTILRGWQNANFEQVKKTCKTPLGETGSLATPYFTDCLSIQFFNSAPVLLTGRHATPEVTRCFSTLLEVLQDTMPRQGLLTFIPREAEDFPKGDKHSKHVPTYLIYLSPIDLYR